MKNVGWDKRSASHQRTTVGTPATGARGGFRYALPTLQFSPNNALVVRNRKNIPIGYESTASGIDLAPSIHLPRTQVIPQFHQESVYNDPVKKNPSRRCREGKE